MDIRYSANQRDVKRYTTQELRDEFLIQNLYQPDTVQAVYSHVDRMVTLGIMPVNGTVSIDKAQFRHPVLPGAPGGGLLQSGRQRRMYR